MTQWILTVTTTLNLRLDRGVAVLLVPIEIALLAAVEYLLIPERTSASC
jgi:hypothetical protein